jgi:HEPN domain-containing protein
MSNHHKVWIEAALNDLETAIYLHQGGFWFQATLSAQQAGEGLGKSILIFSGIGDVQSYSHRISRINKKIQELGLHSFSEADDHIANDMQLTYMEISCSYETYECSNDAPHTLFDRIKSDSSVQWAINYLDMVMSIIPDSISTERRDVIQESFAKAREAAGLCKKCKADPCACQTAAGSSFKP